MQVFDFEPGQDKLHADVFNQPGTVTEILDWGPNTGVRFSDADTGASATIMLMGVTSSEFDAVRNFILT